MSLTLALFDLDKTLIPNDSDHGWGRFLVERGYVDVVAFDKMNDHFYGQYQQGILDIHEYCRYAFQVLKANDVAVLQQWRSDYFDQVMKSNVLPQALQLVKRHQQAGHTCLLVSATNEFIIEPISNALGFEYLIGTQPEIIDGQFTGELLGTPSFQAGKITRVHEWLNTRGQSWSDVTCSFFYSDSINDLPLMEYVSFPIATNPDDRLREIAQQRHWPILELFSA